VFDISDGRVKVTEHRADAFDCQRLARVFGRGERADDTVVEFNTIRLSGLRLSHRQLPLSDHTTEEPRAAH
jgi:hypothetical protein